MAIACKKPCRVGGCPNLSDRRDNLCEEHAKAVAASYNRYERDPDYKNRYSHSWKKTRLQYLNAHPLCEMCEADGRLTPATLVHHKRPLKDGGTNDTSNLQALCNACHERHHNQAGDRYGNGKRVYEY